MKHPGIALLKRKYKDKIANGECCVGGALCIEIKHHNYFAMGWPSTVSLMDALQKVNPKLNQYMGHNLAQSIIAANDRHHYNTAWLELEYALTYKEKS